MPGPGGPGEGGPGEGGRKWRKVRKGREQGGKGKVLIVHNHEKDPTDN